MSIRDRIEIELGRAAHEVDTEECERPVEEGGRGCIGHGTEFTNRAIKLRNAIAADLHEKAQCLINEEDRITISRWLAQNL